MRKEPVANTKKSFKNLQMMNSKKKLSHLDSAVSFGWACVLNPNLSGGSDRPIKTTYRQTGALRAFFLLRRQFFVWSLLKKLFLNGICG